MSGLTKAKYIVEAALFSAGRPITVDEVSEATGLQKREIRRALRDLRAEYEGRESSLIVTETAGTYALEVRPNYAKFTMSLAEQEIPRATLKTLAIIAYHQPILQSHLKLMVGSRIYEDVHILREMGLITARPEGRSLILRTSSRFPEYFGIDADPDRIKEHLARLVGIDPDRVRREATGAAPSGDSGGEDDGTSQKEGTSDTGAPAPPTDVADALEGVRGDGTDAPDAGTTAGPADDAPRPDDVGRDTGTNPPGDDTGAPPQEGRETPAPEETSGEGVR